MDNLQALGIPCGRNAAKTAKETGGRAKADRAGQKHRGECKPKRKIPSRSFPKPTPEQAARIKASKAA